MSFTLGDKGLALIKKFEGCKLTAYQDSAGVWTIGYGHTSGVTSGMTITQAQADAYLKSDCAKFEKYVNNASYVPIAASLNQNQFDALVSFTYNCGQANLKKLCANRTAAQIAAAMPQYNKAGGIVLTGLVNRRAAEVELFNTPVSGSTASSSSSSASTSTITSTAIASTTSSSVPLSVTATVAAVQTWLNANYTAGLAVDGVYGPKTKAALIKAWQTEAGGLAVDGVFGPKSQAAAANHVLKSGSTGILVTIWQAFLVCRSYNPNGIDGKFGSGCVAATKKFQGHNGISQDGRVGKDTMTKAFAD